MNVPTKKGKEWLEDFNKITSKSELALFLNKRWVLLEDHQKEIEKAKEKAVLEDVNFDYYEAEIEAWENVFKEEGWLSPEQIKEKLNEFQRWCFRYDRRHPLEKIEGRRVMFTDGGWINRIDAFDKLMELFGVGGKTK